MTAERTTALLRNSIAKRVDLPEQTFGERIAAFQQILLETGIDAKEIHLEFDDQNPIFNTNAGEMQIQNIPLETVLRYICHSANVDFQVLPGAVEFIAPNRKPEQTTGAGQPATRSVSDSEGDDKPQPESEGRSR